MFSDREKLREVERELTFRERVYKRMVDCGKLRPAAADRQLKVMQAIRDDYAAKVNQELLI